MGALRKVKLFSKVVPALIKLLPDTKFVFVPLLIAWLVGSVVAVASPSFGSFWTYAGEAMFLLGAFLLGHMAGQIRAKDQILDALTDRSQFGDLKRQLLLKEIITPDRNLCAAASLRELADAFHDEAEKLVDQLEERLQDRECEE